MTTAPATLAVGRSQPDWGRVAVVPLFSALLVGNLLSLRVALRAADSTSQSVAILTTSLLVLAFNVMVIVAYLRRGRASATTRSQAARLTAVVATCVPIALPLLSSTRPGVSDNLVAGAVVVVGMGWSVWSLRTLGTNLSVVAQARGLVTTGPYAWVMHPLYVGEIVATFGIALRSRTVIGFLVLALLVLLQAYRAVAEERLLSEALPGYAAYRAGTARLLPGVF
ncbi:MAG: methyltransferase family protein [Actinomycetes bacterium]